MGKKKKPSCEGCEALCCRYIAFQTEKPRTKRDYDDLRWLLLHEHTHVYIDEDGDWIIQVDVPCSELDPKRNTCTIYKKRPSICRELQLDTCEYHCEDVSTYFSTPEDLDRWLRKRKRKKAKKK